MSSTEIYPQLAKTPTKTSLCAQEAIESPDWEVQRKWDGMRALFHILPGETLIFSRTGQDLRDQFPELSTLHEHFEHPAILDGEIVAYEEEYGRERENLELLQMRLGDKKARRRHEIPVSVVFFDVLAAALGESQTRFDGGQHPLSERLNVLRMMLVDTPFDMPVSLESGDRVPAHWEGVVAKKANSPYRPGKRTSEWLKFKAVKRATLRATGLTPGKGSREGSFGAILVEDLQGVHRGQVGSGFSDAVITEIEDWGNWWLHSEREDWPLVEVEYRFLSKTGLMVNTAYKGHRQDKEQPDDLG